jgi:putative transposase
MEYRGLGARRQPSLWHRKQQTGVPWLTTGPIDLPDDWQAYVNRAETPAELAALRRCVVRGAPFGDTVWQQRTAARLGLQSSLRQRGRPKRGKEK